MLKLMYWARTHHHSTPSQHRRHTPKLGTYVSPTHQHRHVSKHMRNISNWHLIERSTLVAETAHSHISHIERMQTTLKKKKKTKKTSRCSVNNNFMLMGTH